MIPERSRTTYSWKLKTTVLIEALHTGLAKGKELNINDDLDGPTVYSMGCEGSVSIGVLDSSPRSKIHCSGEYQSNYEYYTGNSNEARIEGNWCGSLAHFITL